MSTLTCPVCLGPLNSDRAVSQDGEKVHPACSSADPTNQYLVKILGPGIHRKDREHNATMAMAAENGHRISRERRRGARGNRAVCSCGWATSWLSGTDASGEVRKHLKDGAIRG
jgi:hypothetical protein